MQIGVWHHSLVTFSACIRYITRKGLATLLLWKWSSTWFEFLFTLTASSISGVTLYVWQQSEGNCKIDNISHYEEGFKKYYNNLIKTHTAGVFPSFSCPLRRPFPGGFDRFWCPLPTKTPTVSFMVHGSHSTSHGRAVEKAACLHVLLPHSEAACLSLSVFGQIRVIIRRPLCFNWHSVEEKSPVCSLLDSQSHKMACSQTCQTV